MNNLAASCEVSELGDEIYPKGVTPSCGESIKTFGGDAFRTNLIAEF